MRQIKYAMLLEKSTSWHKRGTGFRSSNVIAGIRGPAAAVRGDRPQWAAGRDGGAGDSDQEQGQQGQQGWQG